MITDERHCFNAGTGRQVPSANSSWQQITPPSLLEGILWTVTLEPLHAMWDRSAQLVCMTQRMRLASSAVTGPGSGLDDHQ